MKKCHIFSTLAFSCLVISGYGSTLRVKGPTLFVTTGTSGNGLVYSYLIPNGPYEQVSTNDIGFALTMATSGTTGFVTDDNIALYSIPLSGGGYTQLNTQTITHAGSVAVYGSNAYVSSNASVVTLPITGGAITRTETLAGANFLGLALSVAENRIYVSNSVDGNVYSISISGGSFVKVSNAPLPAGVIGKLAIDGDTLYVANNSSPSQIYSLPLSGGDFSLISPETVPGVGSMAILDDTIYITSGGSARSIFTIPTKGGSYSFFAQTPLAGSFIADGITIFNPPTWNAIPTLTAEIIQTSIGLVVADHMAMSRVRKSALRNKQELLASLENDLEDVSSLEASLSDCPAGNSKYLKKAESSSKMPECPKKRGFYPWVQFFGEYLHEKAGHATPAFHAGAGGAVLAVDYDGLSTYPVGAGIAYAYTKLNGNDDSGSAWINQGALTLYGSLEKSHGYIDVILWGGYYHIQNKRGIDVAFFKGASRSSSHGWQFTPHLEFGYDCRYCWFNLEPFAMADWVVNWQSAFREHGALGFDLAQNSQRSSFLRTETGFRFFETMQFGWGQMILLEKGSYVYQRAFNTGDITATFILTNGTYSIDTFTTPQSLGVGEFEIQLIPKNKKFYANIAYQGAFGSMFQSHTGMVDLGRSF